MSSKIQTYAELQKMIRKALREQHPEWIVQLARRSPGEGLSAQKPYDVGLNFTRNPVLNRAGQVNPDR